MSAAHRERDQAFKLVIEELEADREVRRKALQNETEEKLKVEFSHLEKLKAKWGKTVETAISSPSPKPDRAGPLKGKQLPEPELVAVAKASTIEEAPVVAEHADWPVTSRPMSKHLLMLLGNSNDLVLTKATALEELKKAGQAATKGSVAHAYEELRGLKLLDFLDPEPSGAVRFRLAAKDRKETS